VQDSIGKTITKECQKIFPLQNVLVRKVKLLKKPKFDLTKLMELYQEKPEVEIKGKKEEAPKVQINDAFRAAAVAGETAAKAGDIATAKARLAEVVKDAQQSGPQEITVHGRPVAVVLSRADYDRLMETGESLPAFMRRSPLAEAEDLEFPRDRSPGREVPL
jgi:prevent-host-death family protein